MEFIFPVKNYLTITQGFNANHLGNDYGWTSTKAKDSVNQPIIAAEAGKVITAIDGYNNTYPNSRIYGNYVIIDHGGFWTVYAHLLKGSVCVSVGDVVTKGQTIGKMGNTGYSAGTHLHFELRVGACDRSHTVDPLAYCKVESDSLVISSATLYPDKIKKRSSGIGTPTTRDITKNQVEILITCLRGRSFASVNADYLGMVKKGVYDILDSAKAGDYTFYKISAKPEIWCAFDESWAIYYPKSKKKLYDMSVTGVSTGDAKKLEKIFTDMSLSWKYL